MCPAATASRQVAGASPPGTSNEQGESSLGFRARAMNLPTALHQRHASLWQPLWAALLAPLGSEKMLAFVRVAWFRLWKDSMRSIFTCLSPRSMLQITFAEKFAVSHAPCTAWETAGKADEPWKPWRHLKGCNIESDKNNQIQYQANVRSDAELSGSSESGLHWQRVFAKLLPTTHEKLSEFQ